MDNFISINFWSMKISNASGPDKIIFASTFLTENRLTTINENSLVSRFNCEDRMLSCINCNQRVLFPKTFFNRTFSINLVGVYEIVIL